uniref:PiggyBac transposable element-derived protein domain-containing protein n=1 Tax=Bactrocera latifrons TaxID=174628 RepID=A0A0K8VSK6_BACLA
MCVFYGMMNIACINSYILYCHNASVQGEKILPRPDFMKKLHSQLVEPWLKIRQEIRTMPSHAKNKITEILFPNNDESQGQSQPSATNDLQPAEALTSNKRKACGLCSYKKRRMKKSVFAKCNTAICGEHKADFCIKCSLKN